MEILYHPVSGELLYAYTEQEQEYIKLALNELASKTSSHAVVRECGVVHG